LNCHLVWDIYKRTDKKQPTRQTNTGGLANHMITRAVGSAYLGQGQIVGKTLIYCGIDCL